MFHQLLENLGHIALAVLGHYIRVYIFEYTLSVPGKENEPLSSVNSVAGGSPVMLIPVLIGSVEIQNYIINQINWLDINRIG